ncbi:MAG: aldo/keto reductase [Tannerellaceae bacterium]|jgi:predicted aldo/keto reductase-like oxidoreductase|nr:aldo/keto reductase [Tannerellaceae bacterium]
MEKISRRRFIKNAVGAGMVLSLPQVGNGSPQTNRYDAKGLPTVMFGNTGMQIPKIVLGLGSRFCYIDQAGDSEEMLNYALDNGLYYWDTAHIYDNTTAPPPWRTTKPTERVVSEIRIGEVIKYRRKEVFLSTKVTARNPDEAMREIELSLKRLNTDHLEMLKIHEVKSLEDVDQMSRKGHLIDILLRMKEEGITRFIGFSGHGDAEALKEMANRAPFDSILLMKAVRPKETVPNLNVTDLIRYALSLEGVDALVLGMDSVAVVKSNLELLRNFQPMNAKEKEKMMIET